MPQVYKGDVVDSLAWASDFARSCATRLPSHIDREDLRSVGVLAYLQAASRYNNSLGASFRGYCALRIRGAILDELRRWSWAPRSVHRNQRRISQAQEILTAKLQRPPTRSELAKEMGMDLVEFENLEEESRTRQLVSLNEVNESENGEGVAMAERISDPNAAQPEAGLVSGEDRIALISAIRILTKPEATVIVLYYLKEVPMADIAATMKVTPSRVSQLHHQALARLKHHLKKGVNP